MAVRIAKVPNGHTCSLTRFFQCENGFPNRHSLDSGQTNENGRGRLPPTLAPAILFNHEWTRIDTNNAGPLQGGFCGARCFLKAHALSYQRGLLRSRYCPGGANVGSSGCKPRESRFKNTIAPDGAGLLPRRQSSPAFIVPFEPASQR